MNRIKILKDQLCWSALWEEWKKVKITPVPLVYHVRTLYIVRYNSPTTHLSQKKSTNTFTKSHKIQHTHINNHKKNYDSYIHYQHTNTSIQTTFHILNTLQKDNTHSKHKRQQDNTRSKHKTRPEKKTTKKYNPYVQFQHVNRSLQNNIPQPKYTTNIRIHSLQNNFHVSKVHCGSAFDPGGASGLPYSCTPPVWRSCCNWRATCVVTKKKEAKNYSESMAPSMDH